MEVLSLLEKAWLFIRERDARRDANVVSFAHKAAECCRELIEATSISSDSARLAHDRAIEMYALTSSVVPPSGLLTSEIVLNALSAARIYFWLRVKNDPGSDREFRDALMARAWRSFSLEIMRERTYRLSRRSRKTDERYQYALDAGEDEQAAVDAIRQLCLRDIARLEALLASFPT